MGHAQASTQPRRQANGRGGHLLLGALTGAVLAAAPTAPAAPPAASPGGEVVVTAAQAPPAPQAQQPEADPGFLNPLNTVVETPFKLLSVLDLDFSLGPWTFKGYLQFDGADYQQDPAGPLDTDFRRGGIGRDDAIDVRELQDGSYLRRARIGGEGRLGDDIAYRAMFDVGARNERDESRIAEVWVSYRRFAPYVITAGAWPQPANMEDATGSDHTLFLERATSADLARNLGAGDGRLGVTVRRSTRNWMTAVSLTGPVLDEDEDYSPRSALVGRVSRAFYPRPGTSLHVGGSAIWVLSPARGDKTGRGSFPVRLLASPEVRVDDAPLIDTGDIASAHARVLGVEFAARRRNLFVQAEAFRFDVQRRDEVPVGDPHFMGFYVQGSWILTGEERRFDSYRASFSSPKPGRPIGTGGWGALELAVRYSRMDLNYRAGDPGLPPPPGGVRGGDQQIAAVALEWYPKPRFRFMLNYMHVRVDRLNPASPLDPEPFGPSPATPPVGVEIGQTLDIVAARFRYSF